MSSSAPPAMQLRPKNTAKPEFEPVRGSEVAPGTVVVVACGTTVGTVLPCSVTGVVVVGRWWWSS